MIHRFVDLVPVAVGSLPYAVFKGSPDFTYNIWRVIDGVPTNLTGYGATDPGRSSKWNPIISPDGSTVMFEQQDTNTFKFELWTVPANGGTPTMIKGGSTGVLNHAYWHPDSSHVLYVQGLSGSRGGSIYRIDADGSNDTLILAGTPGPTVSYWRPQYNMDGSLIVFVKETEGPNVFTLRVMEDDASNEVSIRTLIVYQEEGSQYAFANTSNRIAFRDGTTGTIGECYTIDPDGTDLVQISTPNDTNMRLTKYSWLEDDSAILGMALLTSEWRPVTMDPAGGPTMSVINASHQAGAYLQRRQGWYYEGRFYFIEEGGTTPTVLISMLPDGSDYRVEHNVAPGAFDSGRGPEFS